MIVTQTEVIDLAFNRSIDTTRIKDSDINAAEWKYIKPLLGNDLFEDVINNLSGYTDLLVYLKPCAAYYVKYFVLPDLMYEISDRGAFQLDVDDGMGMNEQQRNELLTKTLDKANQLGSIVKNYLVNTENTLYNAGVDTGKIVGGFFIKTQNNIELP